MQAPSKAEAATQCLNAMIADALQHLPFCLQYLELLRHKKVRPSFSSCSETQLHHTGTEARPHEAGELLCEQLMPARTCSLKGGIIVPVSWRKRHTSGRWTALKRCPT